MQSHSPISIPHLLSWAQSRPLKLENSTTGAFHLDELPRVGAFPGFTELSPWGSPDQSSGQKGVLTGCNELSRPGGRELDLHHDDQPNFSLTGVVLAPLQCFYSGPETIWTPTGSPLYLAEPSFVLVRTLKW